MKKKKRKDVHISFSTSFLPVTHFVAILFHVIDCYSLYMYTYNTLLQLPVRVFQ